MSAQRSVEGHLAAVEGLSMQNLASELRRILLPRTRVNKGAPGLSAPLSVAVSSNSRKVRVGLEQPPVVLLGGLHDALPGSPSRAEGGHERAFLAAQDHYVWVRLVYVVDELGEQQLFHLSSSPFRHKEEGSATRGVGRGFPPDPPARTAAGARPGSARPPPRAPLPRSDPRPCRLGPFAPLSCGGRSHSLACPRVHLVASWLVPHSRRWALLALASLHNAATGAY